jgi:thymidylate synthase (FAD)
MKVTLLNPEETRELFKHFGEVASVCYDSYPENYARLGKNCMYTGHFSGSRGEYIKFRIDDCPRFTIDQAVRHEQGVFKNVQSFRYVNKDNFAYEIPSDITDNEALVNKYIAFMENVVYLYTEIQSYVLSKGKSQERANEQARYILPISTHGSFVIGFTLEALTHFMNMRLCTRAEDKIHELALLMKEETLKVLPELEKRLVPNCVNLLWCPEGRKSCGAYPTKKEVKELIDLGKNQMKESHNDLRFAQVYEAQPAFEDKKDSTNS